MFRNPWRRSIAFQLWIRLSLALVAFALLVYPVYLWYQTNDNIDHARKEASVRATVVGGALANSGKRGPITAGPAGTAAIDKPVEAKNGGIPPPDTGGDELEALLVDTFGLRALEQFDGGGNVVGSWGEATGGPLTKLPRSGDLRLGTAKGLDVAVGGSTFSEESINPLGIFQHREYGMVFFLGTPNGEYAGGGYRMVIDMSGLTDDAWALFYRSVLFGGALLLVSLVTLWVLLRYLVARPLRAYSHTALLIAEGAPLRIPNLAKNEIGELGMAINSMADALREQATVDALTGLLNVRHFKAEFPAMLASAKATGEPLSIVNVDVDNLKPVNDTYGHAAGDQVLKAIGSCLLNWGGENAVHWRVGGDEFLVALPGVGAAEAAELAASLEALIATKQITVKGEEIALSVSAGTASYPEDAESMARLVAVADERMYERKARSRDAA